MEILDYGPSADESDNSWVYVIFLLNTFVCMSVMLVTIIALFCLLLHALLENSITLLDASY
jgi:hypothetical protein